MNKLFTKIASLSIGLAMAIGVGVAVSNNSEAVLVHAAEGSVSKSAEDLGNENGWTLSSGNTVGSVFSSFDLDDYISVSFSGIGNTASYWEATSSLPRTIRAYVTKSKSDASFTFTGGTGVTIKTITIQYALKESPTFTPSISNNTAYTVNKNSQTFTMNGGSKNGQIQIKNIACTYTYTPATTYSVTYDGNGETSGSVPADATPYASGATVTVKGNTGSLAKTGYSFGGWNTQQDGQGTNYDAGSGTFSISDNTTLYAKWNANQYNINYYDQGGSPFSGSHESGYPTKHTYGTATTLKSASKDGYSFDGWFTNSACTGSAVTSLGATAYTATISLYAKWTATATSRSITTTVNNGTYSGDSTILEGYTASITFTPNDHYKLPADSSAFTVNHAEIKSYNSSTGVLVLENPDDEVTVSVSMVAKAQNTISMGTLTGVSQADGNPTSVEEGASVTLTFVANEGYGLPTNSGVTVSGTGSSFTWTQGTGKLQITGGTANITVSITGIVRTITSITISSNSGSYELGDAFVMPTVTANYNVGESEVVTSQASATGDGLVNGILTKAGTKTITISYGGQSATYTATVTAVVPSAGGIAKVTSTSDLTVGSTVYLVCEGQSKQLSGISTTSTKYGLGTNYTTTPANTYPLTVCAGYGGTGYAFKNSSNNYLYWTSGNSLNQDSTLSANTSWTISFDASGNATILNVADSSRKIMWNYSSPRFACYSGQTPTYDTASGYNMVQIYKNYPAVVKSLKWITAEVKSGTYYQGSSVTADNFTVTAHYNDESTSTPTSDITVTNGYLANIGANDVTLTYGGKSCVTSVTAVEQTATLTGLTWAQGEYTIINGQNIDFSELGTVTAQYDNGESPSATKAIASCTVATYTKEGDVYTKVADLDDGDEITSASHGKYLGVTYTETNTFTAYSSAPIYVVEELNEVRGKTETWTYSNKVTSLADGDKVVMVASGFSRELTGIDTSGNKHFGIGTEYTTAVSGSYALTVVKISNNVFAFKDSNNKYLCWNSTTDNILDISAENVDPSENAGCQWTVTFVGTEAKLVNSIEPSDSSRTLAWNNTSNTTRFAYYKDSTITGQSKDNYSYVSFLKGVKSYEPTGDDISNTNAVVQKAVLQFAASFNTTMECINAGTTANVSSKWSSLATAFTNAMNAFTEGNLDHFKALFAGADAVEGGDSLQDMLARYKYILNKYNALGYELDDFLADIGRPPVSQVIVNNPFAISMKNTSATIIIVVISAISVAALGGYFLFRKKKED